MYFIVQYAIFLNSKSISVCIVFMYAAQSSFVNFTQIQCIDFFLDFPIIMLNIRVSYILEN